MISPTSTGCPRTCSTRSSGTPSTATRRPPPPGPNATPESVGRRPTVDHHPSRGTSGHRPGVDSRSARASGRGDGGGANGPRFPARRRAGRSGAHTPDNGPARTPGAAARGQRRRAGRLLAIGSAQLISDRPGALCAAALVRPTTRSVEGVPLCRRDFAQMRPLGYDAIRLNLSWSLLEPAPGHIDQPVHRPHQPGRRLGARGRAST